MKTLRFRFAAGLSSVLLVAACAAPSSEPEQAPAPEQELLEVPELEPPPPLDEELDMPVSDQRAVERAPRTGVLPGVEQRRAEEVPFEQRLQERRKRIDLGLDRPQSEQDPVDNVLDVEF